MIALLVLFLLGKVNEDRYSEFPLFH
jgi:hypothetical protein